MTIHIHTRCVCVCVYLSVCLFVCRIDELYAFFIQWSPNIDADAEGFVVVNENISSHLSETSLNEPQLLRTASISKDWEVLFHCLCVHHVQPLGPARPI